MKRSATGTRRIGRRAPSGLSYQSGPVERWPARHTVARKPGRAKADGLGRCQQIGHGREAVAAFQAALDDGWQRLHGLRAVAAAVVHEHDRAWLDLLEH